MTALAELPELVVDDAPETKRKYPRAAAVAVVRELLAVLTPQTERLIVAGSLRRLKGEVGDIEILYIPKWQKVRDQDDLFGAAVDQNVTAVLLDCLVTAGYLEQRLNKNGSTMWGDENKYARHVRSGVPIDFFATTAEKWHNQLVVRTGPSASNIAIAAAAIERGWSWHTYGAGFTRGGGTSGRPFEERVMGSEREVFEFVGMPFLPPEKRK